MSGQVTLENKPMVSSNSSGGVIGRSVTVWFTPFTVDVYIERLGSNESRWSLFKDEADVFIEAGRFRASAGITNHQKGRSPPG